MMHFIEKAKQTEKDLRTRFADDKFAEWEAQVIDALDVDFSLVRREVHTMEEFEQQLKAPFLENKEKIFYRGERVDDRARPLIPTIFRNRQALFDNGDAVAKVTADFVYDFYKLRILRLIVIYYSATIISTTIVYKDSFNAIY
jgi:hypothetical protein